MKHLAALCFFLSCWLYPCGLDASGPGLSRAPRFYSPDEKEMPGLVFSAVKRHSNGQVSQAVRVNPPAGIPADRKTVTVLFRENQGPDLYRITPVQNTYTVYADKPSRIRLFILVTGRRESPARTHLICTDIVLFGDSATPARRETAAPADAAVLQSLPVIRLERSHAYYWHQTGVPLVFGLEAAGSVKIPGLWVRENRHTRKLEKPDPAGRQFAYTPPHDDRLKQSGMAAFRQDMIFTRLFHNNTDCRLAYVLLVHRSRHDHDDHRAGAAALGGSALLFTGLVLKKRKKPWWND